MKEYLGEFPVDIVATEFKDFTAIDWAMYFIEMYGQVDGDHHKTWVIDQVARVLKGTGVTVVEARWRDGEKEYRVTTNTPSATYVTWVEDMRAGGEYEYDEGVAP